jgi:hypothetical protein
LQPIKPIFILSEGAHPAREDENAGARPIAAVVTAVFLMNVHLVVILAGFKI